VLSHSLKSFELRFHCAHEFYPPPLPGPLPQGERGRIDQEPEQTNSWIPRPDKKRSLHSKCTSSIPEMTELQKAKSAFAEAPL
jgi:hypothetical protein